MTPKLHPSITPLLLLGFVFFAAIPARSQFVPDDIQVGAAGVGYSDPEFHSGTSRVVFQNSSAGVPRVWIGEINPATGAFVSANGQDLLVDTAIATLGPTAQTNNGPEWGEDSAGVAVFYSKPDGLGIPQIFRASNLTAGSVMVTQVTSVPGPSWATNATVRQDATLPTTKFFYRYAAGPESPGPARWADEANATAINTLTSFNAGAFAPSWIPGTEDLVFSRFISPTTTDLYRYSTSTLSGTYITNEPTVPKQNIVAFNAPEFNNELCYACVVDVNALAIYRDLGSGYTRVATLSPNDPALPYMYSPEIFQVGGVTYFAVVMQNNQDYHLSTDGAIYVLGLGADAGNRLARRIDNGTAADRFEPEVLVGSEEVFVYFNIGGTLRRARTGVMTQPLGIADVPGTELAVNRGLAYSLTIPVSGGVAPYSWQLIGGALPSGLTLGADGIVSGAPTVNGTFSYTVGATDAAGATFDKTFSVKVADGYAPNAPFIGQQGGSYADPEFSEGASQVTFMDSSRTLWVGDLDPQTATFVTATGRDYQMDTNLSYIVGTPGLNAKYATNGPEWVRDGAGWAVAYTKEDPQGIQQQWKAKVVNGASVITQLTTDAQDCYGNAPSRFDDGLPPRIAFNYIWPIPSAKLGWIFVNDPTNIHVIEGFDPFQMSMWSSVSSDFGYVHLAPGSTTGQIGRLNADTNIGQVLTNDEGSKNDPGFFLAPEFGGELCMVARVDNTSLGVYRNLNAPDGFWTRIATLRLPAGNTHKYIFSTEILSPQTGIGGVTYFVVNAADVNDWRGGDRSIWVLGLGTDPNKRFVRRVDDGALTGTAAGRLEPEPYTATDQAFVFYNNNGLRRAATGIFKSPLSIADPSGTMLPAVVGLGFSHSLTGSGGVAPYAWSLASGTLPPGFTLSSSGLLSGTATSAGTFHFTVQATDERGVNVTRAITLTIAASAAVNDVPVGDAGVDYLDPELDSATSRIVFQSTGSGGTQQIWVGGVNPGNGLLTSATGKDTLIDSGVSTLWTAANPTGLTPNGPEWALDSAGGSLFYTKPGSNGQRQAFRAIINVNGTVSLQQATFNAAPNHSMGPLARRDATLASTKYIYRYGTTPNGTGTYRWADEAAPTTTYDLTSYKAGSFYPAFIPGTEDIAYAVFTGPSSQEIARYATATRTVAAVTSEPAVDKRNVLAFTAPEFGGALCYACVAGGNSLAVYRDLGSGFTRIATLTPNASGLPYLFAPEVFQVGGMSFFTVMAANSASYDTITDSAIYVLGLGTNPATRLVRRVDDASAGVARIEPEPFIGSGEVFIYYTVGSTLRRARAGVSTQSLAASPAPPAQTQHFSGSSYDLQLTATGGTPGYTWSLTSGTLPSGLTLAPDGRITGSSTQSGQHALTFTATDATGTVITQNVTLAIAAVVPMGIASVPGGLSLQTGPTQPGITYQIESSTDLATWQNHGPAIPGDGNAYDIPLPPSTGHCFYRLRQTHTAP